MPSEQPIYKIVTTAEWQAAMACGIFSGAPVDLADGFIHFSARDQVEETARRHFAEKGDLVLLSVAADALGAALCWEPSRGGALFPHLYAPLPLSAVRRADPLPFDGQRHIFPFEGGEKA